MDGLPNETCGYRYLMRILLLSSVLLAGKVMANNDSQVGTWNWSKSPPESVRYNETVDLRVAAAEWQPHIKVWKDETNGSIRISGPMADLLVSLAESLNFRYSLFTPPDGAWGAPDENGNYNGMLGMIQRNEVDLALGPFGMTEARARVAAFSRPIMIDIYRILVKRGQAEQDTLSFLKPLDSRVWILSILSFFLMSAILGVFLLTPWTQEMGTTGNFKAQVFKQFWDQYATFTAQNLIHMPRVVSSRIIVAVWLLAVLVIMRSYSGALTSLLAVRQIPIKIDSLADFVQAKEFTMYYESSTAFTAYLESVESGVFKALREENKAGRGKFLPMSKIPDLLEETLRSTDSAIFVEDLTIRTLISQDFGRTGTCDFHISKERVFPLILCLVGRHGLPIMRGINYRVQRMLEHDLYGRTLRKISNNGSMCMEPLTSITVNEAYDMKALWGLFAMLCLGYLVAFFVLLLEIFIHKRSRSEQQSYEDRIGTPGEDESKIKQ